MDPYLFTGVVLPERAQLSLQACVNFSLIATGTEGTAKISIVLNQIAVWVETEENCDIFDLRNFVVNLVQDHLAMLSYLKGYAYDLEITRVLNPSRGIDYVFGIDIPCISERGKSIDLQKEMSRLREKMSGPNGVLFGRCLKDLTSSMKYPDDTGFYCYRAIESLRHHCSSVHGLVDAEKSRQWAKFREIAGCSEESIRIIKNAADPLRHGEVIGVTADKRAELFQITWDIVDAYLQGA